MSYTNADSLNRQVTVRTLQKRRANGEKFVVIALYDAPMAALAEKCGVEVVLVGDSLGMTVQGHSSTLPVTMSDMRYHVEAVARGNRLSLVMADLPFMAYATPEQALTNSATLMQSGAHMVKLEGGEWLTSTIHMLSVRGIPVCAHLGLTPQSVNKFGGFRVQGREEDQAEQIYRDALQLEQAGADVILLECVPAELARRIDRAVKVPTIGIGAGADTTGQVLVVNDILGLTEEPPSFSKNFLLETGNIRAAMAKYAADVRSGLFPDTDHTFN